MSPYVEPTRGVSLKDAGFYHRLDLPGLEEKGVWDLRGDEAAYLGHFDFAGKRVLEFGTASGALCFWMEKQGAEVVTVDLPTDVTNAGWDTLLTPEDDPAAIEAQMARGTARLRAGFWYAHEKFGSKARLVQGTAYEIPEEVGSFDVVTLCAILLHLRDPMRALENALRFTRKTIIIADLVPFHLSEEELRRPLMYFMPDATNQTSHGGRTWWHISPEVFVRYLQLKGYAVTSNTTAQYRHASGLKKIFTIVAEWPDAAATEQT